jgi:Rad3-related DNA helicase
VKLPVWAPSLRANQADTISGIVKEFESGTNIVMLDAPTGTGKTLVGEMIRQELGARALYLCSTLALQDQFARDFPDAKVLRGRSNYPTHDSSSRFPILSASDCSKQRVTFDRCHAPCNDCPGYACECTDTCLHEELKMMHCRWCHPVYQCPYEVAKFEAINADLVCTNIAYFLHEANYIGSLPLKRDLIIVDEADLLEEQLLSFVTLTISERQQQEYGIYVPDKKTVKESWIEWADTTSRHLDDLVTLYRTAPNESDIKLLKREREVKSLASDLAILHHPEDGLANDNWIYTSYDRGLIEFKPIRVNALAHSRLWRHCDRFLLMSATMISFHSMAESLGLV